MRRAWVVLLVLLLGAAVGCEAQAGASQGAGRPKITGVAFLKVYSTKPDGAQAFYGGLLGMERLEVGSSWVYPVNRTQWIEVLPHTPPPRATDVFAGFGLTTVDAAAMERYLKAHGVAIATEMHDGEFTVLDPEGYSVSFVQSALVPAGSHLGGVPLAVSRTKPRPQEVSRRMIHVGLTVHDRAREDTFYRDVLGFRPYWMGGGKPDRIDWVSQQVPDGHDWVEYMLGGANPPTLQNSGVLFHASLAVEHIEDAISGLTRNGADARLLSPAMHLGMDGKIQLNMFDPDGTRIEFMDYRPSATPCCSPVTAPPPSPSDPH